MGSYLAGIPESYFSTDGTFAADSDALVPSQKAVKTYGDANWVTGIPESYFSTDGTFAADSDELVPSQRAIKTYGDANWGGGGGGGSSPPFTLSGNSILANTGSDTGGFRFDGSGNPVLWTASNYNMLTMDNNGLPLLTSVYGTTYGFDGNGLPSISGYSSNQAFGFDADFNPYLRSSSNAMHGFDSYANPYISSSGNATHGFDPYGGPCLTWGATLLGFDGSLNLLLYGSINASTFPTYDPESAGVVWNNDGVLTVSAG